MPNGRAASCKQPRIYVHLIHPSRGKSYSFSARAMSICLGALGFFLSTMSNPSGVNTVSDRCCLCGFVFVDKNRKRSITGEFAEIFANVCKENIKDGLPRAVFETCKYRVEKAWKNYSRWIVGATERLLK